MTPQGLSHQRENMLHLPKPLSAMDENGSGRWNKSKWWGVPSMFCIQLIGVQEFPFFQVCVFYCVSLGLTYAEYMQENCLKQVPTQTIWPNYEFHKKRSLQHF